MNTNQTFYFNQNSDQITQKEAYERYQREFLRYIKLRINNQEDAKDILHDAYERVYKHWTAFKYQGPIYFWIRTIVHRQLLNYYRVNSYRAIRIDEYKKSLDIIYEYTSDDENESELQATRIEIKTPEQVMIGVEIINIINAVIEKLSGNNRLVAELIIIKHHSHAEVAEMTGINPNSIKTALFRAIKEIRNALKASDYSE